MIYILYIKLIYKCIIIHNILNNKYIIYVFLMNDDIDAEIHTNDVEFDIDITQNSDSDLDFGTTPCSILPTDEERESIITDAIMELTEIMSENALDFKREDFSNHTVDVLVDGYLCQYFSELDVTYRSNYSSATSDEADALNEVMDAYIRELADDIVERFYEEVAPPRVSFYRTDYVDTDSKTEITAKIEKLRAKPQPDQRTPEWYTRRNMLITASAASKAFGTQASVNQLIYEKCKNYLPANPLSNMYPQQQQQQCSVNSPLHWGQRYEPITVKLYEYRNSTKLGEFGCIQHDTYSFIGASPDGINVDPDSPLYGRMVEIKNIVNREITGIPKEEYWVQTQIQMEVCDLDESDFVETRIKEYESETDFLFDSPDDIHSRTITANGNEKGIILWFQSTPAAPAGAGSVVVSVPTQLYEYAPLGASQEEYDKWEEDVFAKHEKLRSVWVRTIYWYVDQYSCVLVKRNRLWFEAAVPVLQNTWCLIERERVSGYEHRAPKRKTTTNGTTNGVDLPNINIKVIKLDIPIVESIADTTSEMMVDITATNMAKTSNVAFIKRPSDVLMKCFKIEDLDLDESKIV